MRERERESCTHQSGLFISWLDRLPLPCIALIQPGQLSCLGSSVVERLPRKQCVVGLSPT